MADMSVSESDTGISISPHQRMERQQADLSPPLFSDKFELSRNAYPHAKCEEPVKMYICHLCDFRTAFRNSLLNHQAVHSDLRPWVCAMCDYAAKRKQDLKKHLHTIHGMMVDSTMLKPVDVTSGSPTATTKALPRREIGEENAWETGPYSHAREMESPGLEASISRYSDVPNIASSPKVSDASDRSLCIKIEPNDTSSTSEDQGLSSKTACLAYSSPKHSPDCDLPICFPPVSLSASDCDLASSAHSAHHEVKKDNAGMEHISSLQGDGPGHKFDGAHQTKPGHDSKHLSSEWFSYTHTKLRKRKHANSAELSAIPGKSTPPREGSSPSVRSHDTDDLLPCSSSGNITVARGIQTQQMFLCKHCDIMFFHRAMYLMHVGLHSPDNPWCCTVCGDSFTEKYSFTSHFINQH